MEGLFSEIRRVKLYVYDLSGFLNFRIEAVAPGSRACQECQGYSTGKIYNGEESADLCNYGYGSRLPLDSSHPLRGVAWSGNDGDTDIYHLFHRLLNSSLRVHDPLAANVFFLAAPFYQIRHKPYPRYEPCGLFHNSGNWTALLDWLGEQPGFKRSQGRDHFAFFTKPYVWSRKVAPFGGTGPWSRHPLHETLMRNVVKASHWGVDATERAMPVPFSTFVHTHAALDLPRTLDGIFNKSRQHLMSYVGGMWRGTKAGPYALKLKNWDIKRRVGMLCWRTPSCKAMFTDAPPDRRLTGAAALPPAGSRLEAFPKCGNASMPSRIVQDWPALSDAERSCAYPQLLYLDSVFCLTPPGDAPSRRGLFDALVMGCIPVLFEELTALYPWYWSADSLRRVAVMVPARALRAQGGVLRMLSEVTEEARAAMRASIRSLWPLLQYSYDESVGGSLDAVDVLLAHVLNPALGPAL